MIHTMKVTCMIEQHHVNHFSSVHQVPFHQAYAYLTERFKGITVVVWEKPFQPGISLFIDIPELLGRGTITEIDYEIVESTLKALLSFAFGDQNLYNNLNLMRIDYRHDVHVPNEDKRNLYIKFYSKTFERKKRLKRVKGKSDENNRFIEYETSVTHVCQSKSTLIYDKNTELTVKGKEPREWEMNIIRFEVSLKTPALKYNARKEKCIERSIKAYFTEELFNWHYREYLTDVYLTGDFYTLDDAVSIIYSSELSDTKKERLKQFLREVKKQDLTVPKAKMSSTTFRGRLKDLKELGIHPVTITDRETAVCKMLPGLLNDE